MSNRIYALISVLFLLILGVAIGGVAFWLSGSEQGLLRYTVIARQDVSGLYEASQVFYRGVAAGRVEAIRFNPGDVREILIEVAISPRIPITRGTYATLRPQGITGLTQLALHDEGQDPAPLSVRPGEPGRIPLRPGLLDKLSGSAEATVANIESVAGRLNALLDEENRRHIAHSLAHLETTLAGLAGMTGDLHQALRAIPELTADGRATLSRLNRLIAHGDTLASRVETLADGLLRTADEATGLGRELRAGTLPRADRLLTELTSAGQEARRLIHTLRDNPQSLLLGRTASLPGPGETGYPGVRR